MTRPQEAEDILIIDPVILNLAVALGIGLLIGAERERRKGEGPSRSPAGIRTFTVTSLAGAISFIVGGEVLLAIATAGVIVLTAVAYWRAHEDDPGLTTEIALIVTALLGGLSMQKPALAAGLAVTVAVLLAARSRLHRFVRSVLTEDELNDALIFAGATLVVLPLVPDRPMGPYGALNPHSIWILVILVMAISAAGYVAVRTAWRPVRAPHRGSRIRLHLKHRDYRRNGCAGCKDDGRSRGRRCRRGVVNDCDDRPDGTCSRRHQHDNPSSPFGAADLRWLGRRRLWNAFTVRALQQKTEGEAQSGRAFSLSTALVFALTLSCILVASAALREWFGETGIIMAAALAGFVDTHSAAISVASLVASGKMSATDAVFPILAGLSTNTISKMVLAGISGGRAFALRVIPGLIVVALAAWVGMMGILVSG